MNYLFTFLSFAFPILLVSQEVVKDEVDEFTGNRNKTVQVPYKKALFTPKWLKLHQQGENYFLELEIIREGRTTIYEDDQLMLKTKDTVVTLECSQTEIFKGSAVAVGHPNYHITESQIKALQENPVLKMRYYMNDTYDEEEVQNRFYEDVIEAFKLILK